MCESTYYNQLPCATKLEEPDCAVCVSKHYNPFRSQQGPKGLTAPMSFPAYRRRCLDYSIITKREPQRQAPGDSGGDEASPESPGKPYLAWMAGAADSFAFSLASRFAAEPIQKYTKAEAMKIVE